MNYRDYFKGKRIAMVGLGEDNKALIDAEFLAKTGAFVTVIDTRSEKDMEPLVKALKPIPVHDQVIQGDITIGELTAETILKKPKHDWKENISFSFGRYNKKDFEDKDLIIRDISIPLNLPYFKEALQNNIPVEVAESLFIKLAPPITLVGITGSSGKTTVAYITNEILKKGFSKTEQKYYFIDPYKGSAPLTLLAKIKRDDIILMELGVELLKELDQAHLSPHIAVITNLYPKRFDGVNRDKYLEEKSTIFKYQTYNNFLIANDDVVDFIKGHFTVPFKAKIMRTSANLIPKKWHLPDVPQFMRENMALALRVSEVLKVDEDIAQEAIENFKGIKGRLEYVKKVRNTYYYNDTAAVTAFSTLAGVKTLSKNKNVVLMFGGADSHWDGKDMAEFLKSIEQYVHTLILLPGSGTLKMHRYLLNVDTITHVYSHSVYDAVGLARDHSRKDDIVLFSPGFPASGTFRNETERGEHFIWTLRAL